MKKDNPTGLDSSESKGVRFQSESQLPGKSGNFTHLTKKTKRFDYQDRLKGKDRFFNAEVATECETYFQGQTIRYKEKKTEHFAFIVDLDAYEYHKVVFHSFLNEVLQSSFFRFSILILVLVNSILIGLQTDAKMVEEWSAWFAIMDQMILSVFLFEIIVKWIYDFRLFWKVYWNVLDFTIVFLIIISAVVPFFGNSKVLVVVRVVRAFRSLRSVSFLSSLKIVTHTIIKSGADMGNILLVLMIFMLVMSVMGVILFDIEELNDTNYFLNALHAWFVLFVCVTQDGWAEILNESRDSNTVYYPLIATYLIIAVSVGAFVFANLIVAVIVANLELSVRELREEKKLSDNPLEIHSSVEDVEIEILPVYDLFTKNNIHLLAQRPLRIPCLRKGSTRRIKSYISLIVALEQNMLEAEIIHLDMEKIMGVMLSLVLQLDMYSQQKAARDAGKAKEEPQPNQSSMKQKVDDDQEDPPVFEMTSLPSVNPQSSTAHLAFLQQLKNRNSSDSIENSAKPSSLDMASLNRRGSI